MASDSSVPDTQESAVGSPVVERVAARTDVAPDELATALVTLHGELLGRHARYERECEYATVDGTRAYRVDGEEWERLADEFGFREELAAAVEHAHTEQAGLLFARSVGMEDTFAPEESGVVVGIDTAEQF